MSAAKAICDHARDWWQGTKNVRKISCLNYRIMKLAFSLQNEWVSVGLISDGSYNIEKGLVFSYPVRIQNGQISIVQGLEIDNWSREMLDKTQQELIEEKNDALKATDTE